MVSANVSVGVAAYRSAVAPVQPKIRSAMSVPSPGLFQLRLARSGHEVRAVSPALQGHRAPPQAVQEGGQGRAGLSASVEPLPFHPQLTNQRVALVDRDQEDLVPRGRWGGLSARAGTTRFGA